MTVKWFGKNWGAPICDDSEHIETPVGRPCFWCKESIEIGDDGITIPHISTNVVDEPYHIECSIRQVIGGLNHLKGRCLCCGGTEPPDPPGMSVRQAAKEAVEYSQYRLPKSVVIVVI